MESAAERKARLKALRQEAVAAEEGREAAQPVAAVAPAANAAPQPPTLKFRNYAPRDEKIEHEKVFLRLAPCLPPSLNDTCSRQSQQGLSCQALR